MKIEKYGAGVFTLSNFLSAQECYEFICKSESGEYELATIEAISGPEIHKEIRNNDRLIFDDAKLAQALYLRARPFLPAEIDDWRVAGFNERFRFYRYNQEHYFKWHGDGTYVRSKYEESMLSFIIYLNEDFTEGYTQFHWDKIYPRQGMALIFPHRIQHCAVQPKHGIKYVLRSDVMYQIKSNNAEVGDK